MIAIYGIKARIRFDTKSTTIYAKGALPKSGGPSSKPTGKSHPGFGETNEHAQRV
jgi:hypothetical protein